MLVRIFLVDRYQKDAVKPVVVGKRVVVTPTRIVQWIPLMITTHRILPRSPWLRRLFEKYSEGAILSNQDLLRLLLIDEEKDLQALYAFADRVREQRVGNIVYYSSTLYLYPTNFCHFSCTFCSYYAHPGSSNGWFFTPDQLIKQLYQVDQPITETHIVAGCFPQCNLDYYVELVEKVRQHFPSLHIKALSAVEYAYLADLHMIPVQQVLLALKSAGLNSIPGGGAEILVDRVRHLLSPNRLSSARFLEIHKTAHQLGIPSNATMLCYHRETPRDIVAHMAKLRALQEETHGFKNFILLKFANENNTLGRRLRKLGLRHHIAPATLIAGARLFFHNIPHIKALWNYLGIDEALACLSCGANDFSSTHIGEKVFRMASSSEEIRMDSEGIARLIRQQGKVPCLTCSENV